VSEAAKPGGSLAGRRVLVTGASGFLGSHFVERLLADGAVVAALARTEGRLSRLSGNHERQAFTFVRCDLADRRAATEKIGALQPEILAHFAGHPDKPETYEQAESAIQVNITCTLNAIEAFRLAGGQLFIYGDSCKVYGNSKVPYRAAMPLRPGSSYAIAKATGWQLCELYRKLHGLATVSVRPTMIYGPHQGYNLFSFVVDRVLAGAPEVVLDGGRQTRDPLFIDDAMEAFLTVARLGRKLSGRILNIGGGKETTVSELAATTIGLMGEHLPVRESAVRARPTEVWRSYCDNREAAELIGWKPRTSLRAGLKKTIEFLAGSRGIEREPHRPRAPRSLRAKSRGYAAIQP